MAKQKISILKIMKSAYLQLYLRTSTPMDRLHLHAVVSSSRMSIQTFTGMDGGPAARARGAAWNNVLSEDDHPQWGRKWRPWDAAIYTWLKKTKTGYLKKSHWWVLIYHHTFCSASLLSLFAFPLWCRRRHLPEMYSGFDSAVSGPVPVRADAVISKNEPGNFLDS